MIIFSDYRVRLSSSVSLSFVYVVDACDCLLLCLFLFCFDPGGGWGISGVLSASDMWLFPHTHR